MSSIIISECNLVIKCILSLVFINYTGQGFNSSGPTCSEEEREGHNPDVTPGTCLERRWFVNLKFLTSFRNVEQIYRFPFMMQSGITRKLPATKRHWLPSSRKLFGNYKLSFWLSVRIFSWLYDTIIVVFQFICVILFFHCGGYFCRRGRATALDKWEKSRKLLMHWLPK